MNGIEQGSRDRRPRPVVLAGASVGVAEAVVTLVAVVLSLAPELTAALLGLVGAVGSLLAALVVQRRVTPLRDPRDRDGRPMAAYDDVPPTP